MLRCMHFTLSMSVCLLQVSVGSQVVIPGTEGADACEPSCRCWELNPDSLQEQQALLPTSTEPSLQSPPPLIYEGWEVLACLVSWA